MIFGIKMSFIYITLSYSKCLYKYSSDMNNFFFWLQTLEMTWLKSATASLNMIWILDILHSPLLKWPSQSSSWYLEFNSLWRRSQKTLNTFSISLTWSGSPSYFVMCCEMGKSVGQNFYPLDNWLFLEDLCVPNQMLAYWILHSIQGWRPMQ